MTVIVDITELNGGSFGTVKGSDVYPAVDVTDTTQADSGTTKPYQVSSLLDFFLESIGFNVYAFVVTCSTANLNATYDNGTAGVNATLTNAGSQAAFSLNGQTGVINDRYLIKDQNDLAQNGIYRLTVLGSGTTNWVLTRTTDFNSSSNIIDGSVVYVNLGTVNSNTLWELSFTGSVVVGTTLFSFAQFSFNPDIDFTWNVVTGTTQQISNSNGYVPRNAGLTTFTLPTVASVGQSFQIRGYPGSGGWIIAQAAGQRLYVGSTASSLGVLGSVASTAATNSAIATCIDDNNFWSIQPVGNLTIL